MIVTTATVELTIKLPTAFLLRSAPILACILECFTGLRSEVVAHSIQPSAIWLQALIEAFLGNPFRLSMRTPVPEIHFIQRTVKCFMVLNLFKLSCQKDSVNVT